MKDWRASGYSPDCLGGAGFKPRDLGSDRGYRVALTASGGRRTVRGTDGGWTEEER